MKTLTPYGDAMLGPDSITLKRPECGFDLRMDDAGNLIALIWPEEMPRELNEEDREELWKEAEIMDIIANTTVSPEVRAACEAEMREAQKRDWRIID